MKNSTILLNIRAKFIKTKLIQMYTNSKKNILHTGQPIKFVLKNIPQDYLKILKLKNVGLVGRAKT